MNSNREELVGLAVTKTGAERAEFLGRECAGKCRRWPRQLDPPGPPSSSTLPKNLRTIHRPEDWALQNLGRVGEGGCGVIYVAEQTEPVRRRVAVKVIKLGMD